MEFNYQTRPAQVWAIQWTGDNAFEVSRWLDGLPEDNKMRLTGNRVEVSKHGYNWNIADLNCWITFDGSNFETWTADGFRDNFEEIK